MRIIAGKARNLELLTPPGLSVRPTAGRSRKALFDSLGPRLPGATVLDLCAGSGALGLEAASRGAAQVILLEKDPAHCRVIVENIERVRRTGVDADMVLLRGAAESFPSLTPAGFRPDLILADPPYAISAELFDRLMCDADFLLTVRDAFLVWEIPDEPGSTGAFLAAPGIKQLKDRNIRTLAGTGFLTGRVL